MLPMFSPKSNTINRADLNYGLPLPTTKTIKLSLQIQLQMHLPSLQEKKGAENQKFKKW